MYPVQIPQRKCSEGCWVIDASPIFMDKLFFFMDGERTLNNLQSPVALPAPFTSDSGFFNAPFRETELLGKVDYQLTKTAKLFYRYDYFANITDATFFA